MTRNVTKARARKGTGSVSAVKKDGKAVPNKWRVCVTYGTDPITGKRLKCQRIVNGTKAEAQRVCKAMIDEHENGLRIEGHNATFGEFSEKWYSERKESGRYSTRTVEGYRYTLDTINAYIGGMKLRNIDVQAVESLYSAIRADKSAALGHRVSETTMNRVHVVLRMVLQKAVDYDLIQRNPCDRAERPRPEKSDRKALSADDAALLLVKLGEAEAAAYAAYAEKESRLEEWAHSRNIDAKPRNSICGITELSCIICVRIALATGMRKGEIIGLDWAAIDLARGVVAVTQTVTNKGVVKEPKTASSVRAVSVDSKTRTALARWKRFQTEQLSKIGVSLDGSSPVLVSGAGSRLDMGNLQRWWSAWRVEAGFPALKMHELRNTQATLLIGNGVDPKTVQTRLGHSSVAMTLDIYAKAIPGNDKAAADLLGGMLDNGGRGETRAFTVIKTA